ncbi:MAG: carbohydrate kinase family protein [Lawsonibacter sp.]
MGARKAMVAGTIALDIIPQFSPEACRRDDLLAAGKTIYIDDIALNLGGLVSNTGIAMGRLGAGVVLTSKVGDDPLGAVIRRLLEQSGVECRLEVTPGRGTSATIVTVPQGGDRVFWHRRGASQEYSFEDLDQEVLERSDLFHFGYPTGMRCMYLDGGENLMQLYRGVKRAGLTTSLDLSLPGLTSESGQADWKGILTKVLPLVDVFLPSLEETLFLFRRDFYLDVLKRAGSEYAIDYIDLSVLRELGEEMLSLGVKVFGLKLGKKGMYLRTAGAEAFRLFGALGDVVTQEWWNREILEPPYQMKQMCSTNGAGDTAIAGFLTGLMEGWGPERCLRLATGAAAVRIESTQGAKAICGSGPILKRIGDGWPKLEIEDLDTRYWSWDQARAAYFGMNDALVRK